MEMSMNEKKALYAFGCPNREATVERLRFVAALAPDPVAKKLFFTLAVKLSDEDCERWYRCFFLQYAYRTGTLSPSQVCAGQPPCSD